MNVTATRVPGVSVLRMATKSAFSLMGLRLMILSKSPALSPPRSAAPLATTLVTKSPCPVSGAILMPRLTLVEDPSEVAGVAAAAFLATEGAGRWLGERLRPSRVGDAASKLAELPPKESEVPFEVGEAMDAVVFTVGAV